MEYSKFLDLARKYKSEESDSEFNFLELLVSQETDVINWQGKTPYKTWAELLRAEALCTITTYRNYKKAREILSATWIGKLGVYASISIANLNEATRAKVLAEIKKWYAQHKVPPTYQRVSKYVRDLGVTRKSTKKQDRIAVLRLHITRCHALLKKHRIDIPEPSPI